MRVPDWQGPPTGKTGVITVEEAIAFFTAAKEYHSRKAGNSAFTLQGKSPLEDESGTFTLSLGAITGPTGGMVRSTSLKRNGASVLYFATLDAKDMRPVFEVAGIALPPHYWFEGEAPDHAPVTGAEPGAAPHNITDI